MSSFSKIQKVLIANRGEIACRIIRCCKQNGLKTIGVFSAEDSDSMHVVEADEAYLLPGVGAAAYINIDEIVKVAIDHQADVVVPGYGFLSENSQFAEALRKANIVFAGPSVESVETFGLKHSARELAQKNDVPIVPGTGLIASAEVAAEAAKSIGFPIMIKSTAGGGGMGLKVCYNEKELLTSYKEVISRGQTLFKNSDVFMEKYVEAGRHIEIQIFGNGLGDVIAFGERECSIQRRHQKVIEEAPSPFISLKKYNQEQLRAKMSKCAVQLASSINYKSAGTVEFLVDDQTGEFYFLEMNTRLQVEHGITEMIYNADLVKLMLMQADFEAKGEKGIPLDLLRSEGSYDVGPDGIAVPNGHAIEVRVYAENPVKNFSPSPGILHLVEFPNASIISPSKLRVDHWVTTGSKVSPYFDPLLAKIMVWGQTREEATTSMVKILQNTKIYGPTINIRYLEDILASEVFSAGHTLTSFLNTSFKFEPALMEFIQPGAYTTIQDLPGRLKYGAGIPLSGPADSLNFQLANIIVGNDKSTAALEISMKGPTVKFHTSTVIALTGGLFKFKVNGKKTPMFTAISIPAGSTVKIGDAIGNGARAYLAIKGGLPDVAEYLGSKACTPTLNLGGHQGRVIMAGDCLAVTKIEGISKVAFGFELPKSCTPAVEDRGEDEIWTIKTLCGPHDSPDICRKDKLDKFYDTVYTVNLNSNRGCVKLDGQSDVFSRASGFDGGSHPSNILEYPYPTCGISVVGSVMSLFGVDGSTLSGFVCIAVPIASDWWKSGQAKVGGKIQFKLVSYENALKLNKLREDFLIDLERAIKEGGELPKYIDELESYDTDDSNLYNTVLYRREPSDELPELSIRASGEGMLILDFGIEHFTLVNCGRQRALELKVKAADPSSNFASSVIKTECSVGSFGIVFDYKKISREEIVQELVKLEKDLPPPHELKITSTLYKLPCCFDHSALTHCIERYMHSQRPYAPYLPSNVDYVRKANNLASLDDFKACVIGQRQAVTAVSFLCGNTLSVNLDPRKRFKTGKYNPARTFTPKGAIGSGAVGHSIYSIDSPGGYMIWGMALPDLCWNTFGRLKVAQGRPWFFETFDQIEYFEVTEDELNEMNGRLLAGKLEIKTEQVDLDFGSYIDFLAEIDDDLQNINEAKTVSTTKLIDLEAQDMAKWQKELEAATSNTQHSESLLNDASTIKVTSSMAANVFKINYKSGDEVDGEDVLIILEAMKMEIPIRAIGEENDSDDEDSTESVKAEPINPKDLKYRVLDVIVREGDVVGSGDTLMLISST